MGRRTVISALCLLMLLSLPLTARRLTTTQMRNNTIRINALEIDEVDIWMGYTLVDTKDKEICYTKEK